MTTSMEKILQRLLVQLKYDVRGEKKVYIISHFRKTNGKYGTRSFVQVDMEIIRRCGPISRDEDVMQYRK